MKKVAVVAVAAVGIMAAGSAKADADLFNVNQQVLDASLAMRRTTTEQFDPIRGQSVGDRSRPDYDPVPVPVGSFQFFPAVNLGAYYDSNIFATAHEQTDDLVYKVNPTMTLASNWGRNAIAITGLGDFDFYVNNDEQNYYAGALQAEGRYDIAEQTWLAGTAQYQRVVELRGGTNTPGNALGPSEYNLWSGNAEAYRGAGQLKAKLDYNVGYYDYQPYELIGGGEASQDFRTRIQNKAQAQVGYDVTQNFQPYVRAAYDWRDYVSGGQNSSNGYAVDAGAKMDWGGIITTEAYLGYLSQDYYNYSGGTTSNVDFGADILWNVTSLTSIEGRAGRSVEETAVGGSSIMDSQGSIAVQHELRRNFILQANVSYAQLDYNKLDRNDRLYDAGTGFRYYINRHLYSDVTYDFERRGTNIYGLDYDRHVGFVRFGIQY